MLFFRRNISSYSDSELVRLYKETGESDYFGELYNRYIPLIYGLCLKYLQEEVKAQDAVMQLFEDLLPKLSRYEIREFRTWIYSVAKNHCFQYPVCSMISAYDISSIKKERIQRCCGSGNFSMQCLRAAVRASSLVSSLSNRCKISYVSTNCWSKSVAISRFSFRSNWKQWFFATL